MVFDLYIHSRLVTTYQSLNKANAALYRRTGLVGRRYGCFVRARVPQYGKRAPAAIWRR